MPMKVAGPEPHLYWFIEAKDPENITLQLRLLLIHHLCPPDPVIAQPAPQALESGAFQAWLSLVNLPPEGGSSAVSSQLLDADGHPHLSLHGRAAGVTIIFVCTLG